MAVEVFLGNPPANIRDWIERHVQPSGHSDTRVVYYDDTNWSGEIKGILNSSSIPDIYAISFLDIGTSVTSIGNNVFEDCEYLTTVTIPESVTSVGSGVFNNCTSLAKITVLGKTTAEALTLLANANVPEGCTVVGELG